MAAELAERDHGEPAGLGVRDPFGDCGPNREIDRLVGKVGQQPRHPLQRQLADEVAERDRERQSLALLAQEGFGRLVADRQSKRHGDFRSGLDKAVGDRRQGPRQLAKERRMALRTLKREGARRRFGRAGHATLFSGGRCESHETSGATHRFVLK